MKERPILFSAPMVRALLDGSKTQTRRVLKPQPQGHHWESLPGYKLERTGPVAMSDGRLGVRFHHTIPQNREWDHEPWALCPYGQPGDRLWVRENGWERPPRTPKMLREGADTWERYYYDADGLTEQDAEDFKAWGFKRRPSIHMPRWASRILLAVTGVRVELLNDISDADGWADGVETWRAGWDAKTAAALFLHGTQARVATNDGGIGQRLYHLLWEQINGAGSWAANPWVWVVEFRRINP